MRRFCEARDVVDDFFDGGITTPVVWQNPRYACFGCSANELALSVVWCEDTESDNKDVLATESGYQGIMVVI